MLWHDDEDDGHAYRIDGDAHVVQRQQRAMHVANGADDVDATWHDDEDDG